MVLVLVGITLSMRVRRRLCCLTTCWTTLSMSLSCTFFNSTVSRWPLSWHCVTFSVSATSSSRSTLSTCSSCIPPTSQARPHTLMHSPRHVSMPCVILHKERGLFGSLVIMAAFHTRKQSYSTLSPVSIEMVDSLWLCDQPPRSTHSPTLSGMMNHLQPHWLMKVRWAPRRPTLPYKVWHPFAISAVR